MIFEKSYITKAGNALMTRASSGTHAIVWTRCGLYQHEGINTLTDTQIIELQDLNNPVATGQPSALFQENEITRISCQCSNDHDGEGGEALAFGLWAKLEGDASDVLFAIAKTGTYSPVTFPSYDGTVQTKLVGIVDLSVRIESAAGSMIGVEPSVFALAKDLQTQIEIVAQLQNDVENLTTKSVTIDTNQAITGVKTFESDILTGQFGDIKSSARGEDCALTIGAYVMNADASQVIKNSHIEMFSDMSYPEIHLVAVDGQIVMRANRITMPAEIETDVYSEIQSKGLATDSMLKLGATSYNAAGTQKTCESSISFLSDVSQGSVDIAADNGYITMRANKLLRGSAPMDIGASDTHFSTLYVDSINGTPFAAADGVKFDSTKGITLNPTRISGANEGVGQIALILVRSQQANAHFPIGTEISSMSYDVTFAKSKRSVANSIEFAVGRSVPTGSHWRVLNEVESNDAPAEGTYNTYLCLAIRIS